MSQPLLCSWSESSCTKPSKRSGFCLKHYPRGSLLAAAKKKGVRVCDDGKRACRNETFNFKLKCENCLKNIRGADNAKYAERKEKGLCTMCGVELEGLTKGIKDNLLQKCEGCYATSRKVEDTRTRENRNFAFEKKVNPLKHFREYADSAARKNIQFELTIDSFTEIVTKPCYYCKKYNEDEVIGIDRIDSLRGYVKGNVLPACTICNMMKQQLTMKEFADHIKLLYTNFVCVVADEETDNDQLDDIPPSYKYRPSKIVDLYSKRNLDAYIDLCKADSRSSAYIQKMVDAAQYTMSNLEFRNYLEIATRSEVRSQQLTLNNERKRVPRKEIFGLLASNKPTEAVKLYEVVFGTTADIRDDMKELAATWNTTAGLEREAAFNKCIIKYNNARAYKKKSGPLVEGDHSFTYEEEAEVVVKGPMQWKVSNIWKAFQNNTEDAYREYLEKDAPPDFPTLWNSFVESVKGGTNQEEIIKEFIVSLRSARHNAKCYKKNDSLLDREDRQVWKNDTVLRAFNANKLEKFKEFTEVNAGDAPDDPVWCKRWTEFVESVYKETDDARKKELISKFLTAQRTKKYRRSNLAAPV